MYHKIAALTTSTMKRSVSSVLRSPDVHPKCVFLSTTEPGRQWQTIHKELHIHGGNKCANGTGIL